MKVLALLILAAILAVTIAATNGEAPAIQAPEPPQAATTTEATETEPITDEPIGDLGTALVVTCKPDGRCLEKEYGTGLVRVNGHGAEWHHWQTTLAERRVAKLRAELESIRVLLGMAQRIDQVLARVGSPMAGTGADHVRSGRRWNINPFWVLGISVVESTWGQASCGPHNAWGILAYCGSGFPTWAAGIEYETRLLSRLGAPGRDIYSVGAVYCPPCGYGHGAKAASVMSQYFGSGPGADFATALAAMT